MLNREAGILYAKLGEEHIEELIAEFLDAQGWNEYAVNVDIENVVIKIFPAPEAKEPEKVMVLRSKDLNKNDDTK